MRNNIKLLKGAIMGRIINKQKEDIKTAQDLLYPDSVIRELRREKDPDKRTRILMNARKEAMKKEETSWHN